MEESTDPLNEHNSTTEDIALCKVKLKICQIAQSIGPSDLSGSNTSYYDTSQKWQRISINARQVSYLKDNNVIDECS